ncbi:hypothetical protein EVJ58_g7381 [Rhodofomes roseus]|uniref:UDENN domain-containing protein n=1 Tax=Rhodofomes roseus TaxID=34475 RepID=A0A4Y9Y4Z1_9APHY|nr:hypothetical protein EVJ58_g7381 [Rhodofomes roseus]
MSIQPANLNLDGLSMEPVKVASLRRWILSLAIVDFDLEVGPKVSCVYPPLNLSPSEEVNIAFSSFPDSPQFEQGSQTHSFRIRVHSPAEDKLLRPGDQRPQTEDGFLYGFSQFTQRRDANSKRGYQQRSVVILTHLAYPALFYTLVERLGPAVLTHGGPMLEAACHNIATWLDPSPGATLELGLLGSVIIAELPAGVDTQQALPSSAISRKNAHRETEYQLLVSLPPPEPPVLSLFEACLPQLWSIWECLVLCEPILVYGPSPVMTSQAIWWLRDVLRPIPVAGDFRPFFTIHDADHAALVNTRPPSSGLILGVTNPYFDRACKHWPHVLSLGRASSTKSDPNAPAGPPPGWKTKHSRYVSKDQTVLQQLQAACSGSEQASTIGGLSQVVCLQPLPADTTARGVSQLLYVLGSQLAGLIGRRLAQGYIVQVGLAVAESRAHHKPKHAAHGASRSEHPATGNRGRARPALRHRVRRRADLLAALGAQRVLHAAEHDLERVCGARDEQPRVLRDAHARNAAPRAVQRESVPREPQAARAPVQKQREGEGVLWPLDTQPGVRRVDRAPGGGSRQGARGEGCGACVAIS